MKIEIDVPEGNPAFARYLVRHVLQGLALGCRPLFVGPHALPPLAQTGVRYQFDPEYGSGTERFRLPPAVLASGSGDCNDLCVYEVARRRAHGLKDSISVADYTGTGQMHAQIRRPDGTIEDPSIALGAPHDWPEWFLYDQKSRRK